MEKLDTKDRSPGYPSKDLETALDLTQKIYAKDRANWTTDEVAVDHLGFQSLNGNSRSTLSSLKKFGLIESQSGKMRVSGLALRIFHPKSDFERAEAIQEALISPKIFQLLSIEFPNWELPSDQTLVNRLVRDHKFLPSAAKSLVETIKKSVNFAYQAKEGISVADESPATNEAKPQEEPKASRGHGLPAAASHLIAGRAEISLPNPFSRLEVPERLTQAEKVRITRWLDNVVKSWLEFVVDEESNETDE